MRFKRHLQLARGFSQIEIVPLINVVFLIFGYYALSSVLVSQSKIQISLPKVITSEVIKEENIVITITSEDVMYINNKLTTLKELRKELSKSARSVLIKSDRRASLGRMIDVWNLCRDLGIENVNIATNQER